MSRTRNSLLFLVMLLGICLMWAATINVGPGEAYTTIQAAINAATTVDGDVIQIAEGTYNEALTIGKSLTLIGSGPAENPTTILASAASPIVQLSVTGKSFTFQNLIVEGNGTNLGIRAGASIAIETINIQDVIARNCKVGIYLAEGGDATIVNNLNFTRVTITNNAYIGAYIGRSVANGIVDDCLVTNNGYSDAESVSWQKCGIQFIDFNGVVLPKVQVINSTFINNGTGASSIERTGLVLYTAANTLSANELMTVSGCSFSDHPLYAVRIRNGYYVHNTATVNGTFTNNYLDIWFSNMDGFTSTTSNVRNSFAGVRSVGPDQRYDYNTIQAAINAASTNDVVLLAAGTYNENVNVNKTITLRGNGNDSIIQGISGVSGATTLTISASNVTVENLAVTRLGNTVALWNTALNSQGITINTSASGTLIQNCYIFGNRTGVYLNNTQSHTVKNCVITNNRTGVQLVNNVSNCTFEYNQITNNWTMGVLMYNETAGFVTTNAKINNNNISGNWYSQIECKTRFDNPTVSYDCKYNYYGTAIPTVVTTLAGEPGYAAQIPVCYGGTAVNPGLAEGYITGQESAKILYDPWYADAAMTTPDSNSYIAGHSYTFTVNSPNSEDGAKAYIWGFYTNNANAWVNTTYGSALIQNGQAEITYTVPNDYKRDFYWEVVVAQSPANQTRTTLWNPNGPWDQFDTYMLRGQTLSLEAYRFDNFTMDLNTASFKMVNNIGTYPQGDVEATVEVLQPWQGDISEYDNSLYNNTTLYRKIGFYPTYATDRGYTVEVVASNPGSPQFQQIRVTKPSIGYDVTLFGFRNTTTNDALGYMWWTTFPIAPLTSMDMTYDPLTGTATGSFATPLSYNVPYFIQPLADMDDPNTDYVFSYSGGSMDMLLAGGVITPIHNTNQGTYFSTVQAAVSAAADGDVIELASGTYQENLYIDRDLTIRSNDRNGIVFEAAPGMTPHNLNGSNYYAVIFVDNANVDLTGVTVNGMGMGNVYNKFTGITYWKSSGTLTNCTITGVRNTPFSGAQHGVSFYANHESGTNFAQDINLINCSVLDYQKVAIAIIGEGTHADITGCTIVGNGPTNITAQNGIQISGLATAVIQNNTISGNYWSGDNWAAANILLSQPGSGVQVIGNTLTNSNASVYSYAAPAVLIQDNIIHTDTDYGVLDYSSTGSVIDGNNIYDCYLGLYTYAQSQSTITDNTFNGNEYGVYMGGALDNITVANNNFGSNVIQLDVSGQDSGQVFDLDAIVLANTWAGAYIVGETIFSNTASMIYAEAPEALIKDEEEQTYSIKAVATENMRGATVRIVIPKVDFAEPNTFTMGANFEFMDIVESHTTTEWVYDVTVSMLGVGGITANDYTFFTWKMTSLVDASNLAGSIIGVPYDYVIMYDEMNQPMAVLGTTDATVIIDSGEPELEHDNATTYPSGMLLTVDAGGSGLLVRPVFELTMTDDYDLSYAQYMIIAEDATAPDAINQFSLAMPAIDGTATTGYTWQLPESVDGLDDGLWTVYFIVVDDAGNFSIYDWDFEIDKTVPATPLWTSCLTTVNGVNSVDLVWTGDAAKYDIWVLNYDDLTDAGAYPLYNPAVFGTPAIPAAPNAYNPDVQNGWTRLENDLVATSYTHNPGVRGYYYYYIFAEDLAGNYSPVSELRESISYWPGDVNGTPDGLVTADDITLLGSVWGLTNASGSFVDTYDVGPSIGRLRRGRPTPDGRINIEDLMMFSMNYMNTNYTAYPRSTNDSKPDPVRIDIEQEILGNELIVRLILSENNGLVKGLNIPLEIGSGLELQSVTAGTIWNEESILLHTNEQGKVELSGSNLVDCIADNGLVATLSFKISGQNTELALKHMIARAFDNSDIEIIDNPQDAPSGDEDPEIIIPAASFLGANYPNPFNPTTTIGFGLNESGNVKISVFNSRGQLVRTLVNGTMQAGMHNVVWNGMDDSNRPLGSGIYFIKMQTRNLEQTTRAIMVK